MTGIHYVTDENGRRIAVQIDLERHRELWEDFEDALVAEERKDEETSSYEEYRSERLNRRRPTSA
jgi:hypothetical protein